MSQATGITASDSPIRLAGRCEAVSTSMCYVQVLRTQASKVRVAMLRIIVGSVAFRHNLPRKRPEYMYSVGGNTCVACKKDAAGWQ